MSAKQATFDFLDADRAALMRAGRAAGEAGKERGMRLAADRRAERVDSARADFLRAILSSPDGRATLDDATADLSAAFEDGGRWRGSVPRSLAEQRIIVREGWATSCRPSRHAGPVSRWRLLDRPAAVAELSRLDRLLAALSGNGPPVEGEPSPVSVPSGETHARIIPAATLPGEGGTTP